MVMGPRPPFIAMVEPLAAGWLLREIGERAEEYARVAVAHEGTPAAALGRQLQRAMATLREADRQRREAIAGERGDVPVIGGDEVRWLSTAEVASECLVSDRAVRGWIAGGVGPLAATRVGRSWRVRSEDLDHFRNGRAEAAG